MRQELPEQKDGEEMKPWSERIPAAIAKGEKLLNGDQYVLIPPHMRGNETEFTVVLTAGEVALAKAVWGWEWWAHCMGLTDFEPSDALIAYTEKIERLSHD